MLVHFEIVVGERPGPHLLIVAGVHGDEWEPMEAVRQLASETQPRELNGRLTLVPIVNEPAYRFGRRVAEDNLDLARVCPGRADGSITEQIAFELAGLIRGADYFIDLHTGGTNLRIWPLAGYLIHSESFVLEKQRLMARSFHLPVVWGTDPTLEGRTLSVARDASIPAIYVEYQGSIPFCHAAVEAMRCGCQNVMHALGMLPGDALPDATQFFAEDSRPNSGHLQICYPAPAEGLFVATVEVGDKIFEGDTIGFFTDDVDFRRTIVRAESSGRVVALRSMPRVSAGEGLAVIAQFEEIHR
ncbi:MAG: M14 family metallopeptidase [Pirellulales bacterium]